MFEHMLPHLFWSAQTAYDFFKVVDGYDNPRLARRYVNWNSVTVDFITYFRPN